MSFCSFADGAAIFDATPIENLFLMNYMVDASDLQLKVYLYTRMLAIHPELGGTLADIAKHFHITEAQVYDVFAYWENRGLVRRLTDNPPTYALQPVRDESHGPVTALDREMYANREFNNRLRNLFDGEFIGDRELRKAESWLDTLKFTQEAVLRMVAYGIELSPKDKPKPPSVFKNVDKFAEQWSMRGIRTLEDVERAIAEETGVTQVTKSVLKKLGITRKNPSETELEFVTRWTEEWGYTQEDILEACGETVNAQNPSIGYLNAILENKRDALTAYYRPAVEVLRELTPGNPRPSPDQLRQYKALIEKGYAPELIQLAAVQCRRLNANRFEDLEWRLSIWRDEGVATPEEADSFMRRMGALSRELKGLFKLAGYENKRPKREEIKTYEGWKELYPPELIQYAAERSKHKGGSVAYMDKVLARWHESGVTTVEQAKQESAQWSEAHKGQPQDKPANPALDYAQREYKDEDFGDDFFVDLDRYGEEDKA
ncbi:MAG: DnaD domain protein [Clostridia bacterium]|nr:DnaD domain protein [Clostridia bacterium]